ncbi:GNAT family N-acetyltransferase [Roseivirga echinicomitans]|uniref:GCN5 family acetyltransferase n=1 Tax=Roseivirga echinicomitans TaxID=296218 RepID=A0A150X2P4_9BACT|nr:GNAT family N-acetyltransferase [Roseivirga echinicomitans]KYG72995.1 GCN5 family acetyltransferase [Roseivirga echinicomitans]
MKFLKTNSTETIDSLGSELYQKLTTPIDAMWELLYIASSQHYFIEDEAKNIGYCCIDDGNSLLQIYLIDEFAHRMDKAITSLIESGLINSAKLSSSALVAFNTCLFHSKSIKPNTICYQHTNNVIQNVTPLNLELATEEDISGIKTFLKEQVGMDDTFGYTENLVTRQEIYFIKESDVIIATSECRMSDTQPEIADLGIIVSRDHQGKGMATQVMQTQVNRVLKAGRRPICSTTFDNVASRKAIEKSGFYCTNVIFDISF